MIFLGFPPNLADFDPVIIEKDQIEQKGNGFLQSISSGTYITFTSSKIFNNFFLSGIDTSLKVILSQFKSLESFLNISHLRGVSIRERKKLLNSLLEVNVMYAPDEIDGKKPSPFCSI